MPILLHLLKCHPVDFGEMLGLVNQGFKWLENPEIRVQQLIVAGQKNLRKRNFV